MELCKRISALVNDRIIPRELSFTRKAVSSTQNLHASFGKIGSRE